MTYTVQPVGDTGLILRFGDHISDDIHAQVLQMQARLEAHSPLGITELVPSYAALFVGYDPLITDYETFKCAISELPDVAAQYSTASLWTIPVCYDTDISPDIARVADMAGLSIEAVIDAHTSARYKVYMYGFAPGYAYLGGVPDILQFPRKTAPVRGVPDGTVCIAGPQALVTTVTLPNGWWRIGRTAFRFLRPEDDNPFPLNVGDEVRFERVSRATYERELKR